MHDRFPPRLLGMGYDQRGNRWNVDPDRHLLHAAGSTPALDQDAVDYWARHGIETVRVHLRDGRTMHCDLADFIATAREYDFGHGKQLASKRAWKTDDARDLLHHGETQWPEQ